jgi:hypothetical protein
MKEEDYKLIQRLTTVRTIVRLMQGCHFEEHTRFQEALGILYDEVVFLEGKVEIE